jgi:acyl-CoA thioesterase FadM
MKPLKIDDQIIIETVVIALGGASIKMIQNFYLIDKSDKKKVAKIEVKVVLVNHEGILMRMPPDIHSILKPMVIKKDF